LRNVWTDALLTSVLIQLRLLVFFFSSRRRHTRSKRDWSSDVCSSDLPVDVAALRRPPAPSAVFTGTLTMFQQSGFTETARTYPSRPVMRREGSEGLWPQEVRGRELVSSIGPQEGVPGGQAQGRTASYTTISLVSPLKIRWSAVASCRTYPARSAVRCDAIFQGSTWRTIRASPGTVHPKPVSARRASAA